MDGWIDGKEGGGWIYEKRNEEKKVGKIKEEGIIISIVTKGD